MFEAPWRRVIGWADRYDARRADRSAPADAPVGPGWPIVVAAVVRLGAAVAVAPVAVPVIVVRALRSTRAVAPLVDGYGLAVDALLEVPPGDDRVATVPADARVVVTSDLHRGVPGAADWPTAQGTASLYAAVLEHYAAGEWTLVENGDVEDFWLVGGSAYGVVYDLARLLARAAVTLGFDAGSRWRAALYREHLRRIVANHDAIYRAIQSGFHRHGRYRRVIGNHDDVLADAAVGAVLDEVHPGVRVVEAVVLVDDDRPGRGVGVITHGHHPDSWNAPGHATLGRVATWVASVLADLPVIGSPGRPRSSWSRELLSGLVGNELRSVDPVFGVNGAHDSVDEVRLAASFRDVFGDEPPWLLLGHTHFPLLHPWSTAAGQPWPRYVNSGSAVSWELLTAVEWDASRSDGEPVRLVAWHFADVAGLPAHDDTEVVGTSDGRLLVRRELTPDPTGRRLTITSPAPRPGAEADR